ncbi:hypothetical protein C8R43DRAFT_880147, partial [Mycena crocata]
FTVDPKEAMRDLLNSPFVPALPETLWKPVLLDRFVDFDVILGNAFAIDAEEPQQLLIGDSHLENKKPKVVTKISTQGQWINSFHLYEDAVNFVFEARHGELRAYWTHINDLFSTRHHSLHSRIVNYDRAARVFVGQQRDILLHEFATFRHIQDAHLLDGGVAVVSSSSGSGGQRSKAPGSAKRKRTQEVCRNFNYGHCKLGSECNYRHVCLDCNGGGHVASGCPDRSRR